MNYNSNFDDFIRQTFKKIRGTDRTNLLNQCIIDEYLRLNPQDKDLRWETEQRIDDAFNYRYDGTELPRIKKGKNKGKRPRTFKVDICGFNKLNLPEVIILGKAFNNNVLQNIFNYPNTSLGESDRLLFGPHEVSIKKLVFFTLFPNKTVYMNKDGAVIRQENVLERMLNTDPTYMLKRKHGEKVEYWKYGYDIDNLNSFTCRSDFEKGIKGMNLKRY